MSNRVHVQWFGADPHRGVRNGLLRHDVLFPEKLGRLRAYVGQALVVALVAAGAPAATAAPPSGFFNIDGSIIQQSNTAGTPYDWANGGALTTSTSVGGTWSRAGNGGIFDGGTFEGDNTPPLPPAETPAAQADKSIVAAVFGVDAIDHVDTTACGSKKDPSTFTTGADKNNNDLNGFTWGTGNVQGKDDLTNVYAVAHVASASDELYFGAERVDTSGDAHTDFTFLQYPVTTNADSSGCAPSAGGTFSGHRTQGDVMISVDWQNGGGTMAYTVYLWQCDATFNSAHNAMICDPSTSWPDAQWVASTTATGDTTVMDNLSDTGCGGWVCRNSDGTPTTTVPAGGFAEGGIDLAAAGITGCFSSFLPESRASGSGGQSINSDLSDFVGPFTFDTCAQPTVATTLSSQGHDDNPHLTVTAPASVADHASLSHTLGIPTGFVTYTVYTDSTCKTPSTDPAVSQEVALNPDGTVPAMTGVSFPFPGTYYFQASYSGDPHNLPAVSPCTAEVLTVDPAPPSNALISVTKTADASPVNDGSNIAFTITVGNAGPATATSVVLHDPLPTAPDVNWSIVTATSDSGCSISATTLDCSWPSLVAGGTKTIHIMSGTTSATGAQTLQNVATVASDNGGSDQSTATVITKIPPTPAHIEVTKTADTSPVDDGDQIGFRVTVQNTGQVTATGVSLNDPLPAAPGVDWSLDGTQTDITCTVTGPVNSQVLACTIPSLPGGASGHAHVISGTDETTGARTVTNTVTARFGDFTSRATATVTTLAPELNITKTADNHTVSAGDPIGFTIVVSNNGNGTAHDVGVSDTLSSQPGLSWSASGPMGACAIGPDNALVCRIGDLAPNTTVTVHVGSPTTPATCGTVDNTALVHASNAPGATSGDSVTVLCPDVSVTKTAVSPTVQAGDPVVFSIHVSDSGRGTAHNVVLNDPLPSGPTWSITSQPGPPPLCAITSGVLHCAFGNLAPGATTATVVVSGTTSPDGCGTVTNTATVSADNEPADALGNNTATAVVKVKGCTEGGNGGNPSPPSISISKWADDNSVSAGDEVGFTIEVDNDGDRTAHDVTMVDHLPDSGSLDWHMDPHNDACTIHDGTLTCHWDEIKGHDGHKVHIVSDTTPQVDCDAIHNKAKAWSDDGGADEDEATVWMHCAWVHIDKTADESLVHAGNPIGFTIVFSASGTDDLQNVVMTDPLPNGSWTIADPVPGCGIADYTLICTRDSMDPGDEVTVHIVSPTSEDDCGVYPNTAKVKSDNGGRDESSAQVIVKGCPTPPSSTPPTQSTTPPAQVLGETLTQPQSVPPTAPQLAPAPEVAPGQTSNLPFTGFNAMQPSVIALLMLGAGGLLTLIDRRRSRWHWEPRHKA